MRMGKPIKKSRSWKKAGEKGKPKHASPESVVGQISADLISTVFLPKITEMATESLEFYADELLMQQDYLAAEAAEAQVGSDGSLRVDLSMPIPPKRPIFHSQFQINELSHTMTETSNYFFEKGGGWKVHANAAKFERMLDEKYGIFRPFIKNHPEVEVMIRSVQRKYAMGYFSPLRQTEPPIPRTTSIILLFMMQRGSMRWEITVLSALFLLVGLQPWALVGVVALLKTLFMRRKGKPVGTMTTKIPAVEPYYPTSASNDESNHQQKQDILRQPVGKPLAAGEKLDTSDYDTILLGFGPESLYTASLLSRAGRKVLVLSARADASGCLTLEQCQNAKVLKKYQDVPFDVEASNISKISRQQEILVPALSTKSDYQGGIRFAKIGSQADGYAFEILSIPGMGSDGRDQQIPFILKAGGGIDGLMDDTATCLGDGWPGSDGDIGNSTSGGYVAACESINSTSSQFYLSKILPDSVNKLRSAQTYEESAVRHASSFLNKCFPFNVHTRSLMAGMGMKGENLKPSMTSMAANVTNICAAMSGEGMHYPVGGPRALCRALSNIVEQSGGRIVTDINVKELLFDEEEQDQAPVAEGQKEKEPQAPRCVGVALASGQELRFSPDHFNNSPDSPVVVSMQGLIRTFVHLLPDDIRSKYKVPRGLPALSERRPVFKILFALKGSADELSVTGADFYRLPAAAVARDEIDQETGAINCGEIGWTDEDAGPSGDGEEDIVESINSEQQAQDEAIVREKRNKGRKSKFETGFSWMQIAFPSAKDPSFASRHGDVTTCVVTIEADDDFVTAFDTKPKLFVVNKATAGTKGDLERLSERIKKDLFEIYPQLEGNVEHCEIRGPLQKGLSHNPERYAAKGVRAETPYPGLFVGGSDLTVGESFAGSIVGGWLAANAVVGYSAVDHLFLQKNITTDVQQFLQAPELPAVLDSDVAVPYIPRVNNTDGIDSDPEVYDEKDKSI
jgi:phytoene dehydrogenase-like protein